MKPTFATMFLVALTIALLAPTHSSAQPPDTVIVYANAPGSGGPTIEQFIGGDTTAAGVQNNHVYVLQQTGSVIDTPYYYQAALYPKGDITIIGKTNPATGMPPVIQPWKLLNNTAPSNFIIMNKPGTITLKNLYFLGQRIDSVQATANLMNISGSPDKIIMDHCVIDNANGTVMNFTGTGGSVFVTNCEMRNVSNQFWRSGVLMWENSPNAMDTVVMQNNTFFLLGRSIIGGPYPFQYFVLNHNTVFLSSDAALNSTHQINATITNNVFYGVDAHGIDSTSVVGPPGPGNDAHQPYGVIMTDSLKGYETIYGITEQDRNVAVSNNAYFWPQGLLDMWKTINDTATTWYIARPTWMNPQTASMFGNPTGWPGFVAANNDSVDPGFDASLVSTSVTNLVQFEELVGWQTPFGPWKDAGAFRWWQLWTNPYPGHVFDRVPAGWNSWSKGYPVPENLRYSNTLLQHAGTDGLALGDLNWFPEQVTDVQSKGNPIPSTFNLGNNYPNPFNPTTSIKVSLDRSGVMSLQVYNVLGQLVSVVEEGYKPAGQYTFNVSMDKFASGVYFYTLRQGSNIATKKMILMK
ncbi:MAG TPA: T9SS type A sorting domain-containing protein [Bacteroidota bacterium]|nr:T9SS type A sorting domain-containing protein [Bacteroidota bacterium]